MDTGHRKQPELRTRVQPFFGAKVYAVRRDAGRPSFAIFRDSSSHLPPASSHSDDVWDSPIFAGIMSFQDTGSRLLALLRQGYGGAFVGANGRAL